MNQSETAVLFVDGASNGNPGKAAVGVFLEKGAFKKEFSKYIGIATNNIAEYVSLIYGLQLAFFYSLKKIRVYTDSQLLANQINGLFKIKDKNLKIFYDLNKQLISFFDFFEIIHVPREKNKVADKLAAAAIELESKYNSLF